jgi:hypothetical protein
VIVSEPRSGTSRGCIRSRRLILGSDIPVILDWNIQTIYPKVTECSPDTPMSSQAPAFRARRIGVRGTLVRIVASQVLMTGLWLVWRGWETVPEGPGRVWMVGVLILAIPLSCVLAEFLLEPIHEAVFGSPWWQGLGSAGRVIIGVLVCVLWLALTIATTAKLEAWLTSSR